MREEKERHEFFTSIWVKGVPFKIAFLMWRLCKRRIPMGKVLIQMRVVENMFCCCCNTSAVETFEHLFCEYPNSKIVWNSLASAAGIHGLFIQLRNNILKEW